MSVCVITHRLNLVLRFIDTTTGRPISGSELMLSTGGKMLHPIEKAQGTFIFINLEKNDFDLSINSYKETEYEEVKYENPKAILIKIQKIEEEIIAGLTELKKL